MSTAIRRRHTLRDEQRQLQVVAKLGTYTARAFYVAVDHDPQIDHRNFMCLVAVAHHADVLTAAGEDSISYPEDVAEILGTGINQTQGWLRILKAAGLISGTAQAGYRLAGEMIW
jgi:hypothetical protein